MLYQPQTDWKPQSRGERSTEANPITRSISMDVKQKHTQYNNIHLHYTKPGFTTSFVPDFEDKGLLWINQ